MKEKIKKSEEGKIRNIFYSNNTIHFMFYILLILLLEMMIKININIISLNNSWDND